MKKFLSIVNFLRPINLMMVFAMFWVYEYFLIEPLLAVNGIGLNLSNVQLDLLALATVLVALSGYWINDWNDREIDRINRPNRFLVWVKLNPSIFYTLYLSVVTIGFLISLKLSIDLDYVRFIWLYPLFVGVMWYYSTHFKKQGFLGNLVVSAAIASIPWLILLAEKPSLDLLWSQNLQDSELLLWHVSIFSILMFVTNLGRELAKDGEDLEGDQKHNSESLLSVFGIKRFRWTLFASVLILFVLELLLLFYSPWVNSLFFQLGFALLFLMIYSSIFLFKAKEKSDFSRLNFLLKSVMLLGMIQLAMLSP